MALPTPPIAAPAVAAPAPGPSSGEESWTGLTTAEATSRLAARPPGDPLALRVASPLRTLAAPFANPLVATLLIASAIAAGVGEVASASIIALMVLLSAGLHAMQTWRSSRAVERLRQSVAPTATVRRDGSWCQLPRQQLVEGDVIQLAAGDLVPADARLLSARDLHAQQAALTGEALPVEKVAQPAAEPAAEDDAGRVYLGTSIVSGTGIALVTATGRETAYGDIVRRLLARPPETEFEHGMRAFSVFITKVVLFLVFILLLASVALHRDPLQSLLFAVALAVGLVPEFMPMITSVTLANGAVRMAREEVIVKHLQAIQNLGSIDVLCSDKTGTLTTGEMRVTEVTAAGAESDARVLALARLNSGFETGIRSPLDAAILRDAPAPAEEYRKVDEIPFDFDRRLLSIVVERPGERLLITKGAPESVLGRCTTYGDDGAPQPLDDAARARAAAIVRAAGQRGDRLLAVATRRVPPRAAYDRDDETGLTLAGWVAFSDPPLPDADSAIAALAADGVHVKILSGDNELVAAHVCAQAGLPVDAVVLGSEIDRLGDPALAVLAERTTVFARVSPAQKTRVLAALRSRGHVVGFLGDGINDAPALHTADVGISVAGAVDVARDAADVVLLRRDLRVLHTGIIEGRKAFGNVMKYLLMGTSSNFGNMFSMAIGAFILPFLPMLPTQILLNNFLYDVAQVTIPTDRVDAEWLRGPHRWDITFIRRFMVSVGPVSSVFDLLTFAALLLIFHASAALFHTGWFVESLVTQTLVLLVIRTVRSPLRSRPSAALAGSIAAVVLVGMVLPWLPVSALLGFTPLPARFFLLLVLVTAAYLVAVERVKAWALRRWSPLHG